MIGTRLLAASFIAALAAMAPQTATAADLDGDYGYQDQGQDYDDAPRYSDKRYDNGYGNGNGYNGNGYNNGYNGSTKDGYLEPPRHAPRFSENDYGDNGCTPRWQVRKRLVRDGWGNFQRLAVRPRVVVIRADRYDGRSFDLKLDRCTGHILAQRPSHHRGYGAYGPGPRRYGWAY